MPQPPHTKPSDTSPMNVFMVGHSAGNERKDNKDNALNINILQQGFMKQEKMNGNF